MRVFEMTLAQRWDGLHKRLESLTYADQEEEAELLSEAYDRLTKIYQEARELNIELEELVGKYMHISAAKLKRINVKKQSQKIIEGYAPSK